MHRLIASFVLMLTLLGCSDKPAAKDAPTPPTTDGTPKANPPEGKLEPVTIGKLKAHKFGDIYFAAQPGAEDFAEFKELGVTTVIDLRDEGENRGLDEAAVLSDLKIEYHNPGFKSAPTLTDPIFRRVRDLMANKDNQPLLVHCASANRVGAVWLAHRVLDHGVPYDKALEEAKAIGMKPEAYEARVKEYIDSKPE